MEHLLPEKHCNVLHKQYGILSLKQICELGILVSTLKRRELSLTKLRNLPELHRVAAYFFK